MEKPTLNIVDFEGMVTLKDWARMPDGNQYSAVAGRLTIYQDKEALGFEVKGTETNWGVRVAGTNLSEQVSVNILGCQIRAISNWPLTQLRYGTGANPKEIFFVGDR